MTEVYVTTVEDTDESDEGSPTITKQRSSVQDTSPSKANDYGSIQHRSTGSWRNRIFDFRSGRKCPTCQGTGNIPRGQDDELVALIPYSDKRLRPRRRWIYVCIVLCVVLVFGVLLLAFMFPRSATISLTSMNSSTDFIPIKNHSDIIVVMQTHVHIKNSNFFDLSVQYLRIKLYNINTLVGIAVQTSFTVSARGDTMAVVQQNATFTDELARRVRTICTGDGWKHCLYMLAEAQLQYTVLSHSAEAVTSDYFFVSCDFIETGEEWTYSNSCTS